MSPLIQYLLLFGMLVCSIGFALMIYLIARTAGKAQTEPGKDVPAESGNYHKEPVWVRYHVHYYGFALLFLCFDMEMAYMYPWAVVYRQLGMMALLDMGVFLMILFLGLLYSWSQGGLKRQ